MADQGSTEAARECRGRQWIWGGLAALLLANGVALFVPSDFSARATAKTDSASALNLKPTSIQSLAASPRDHGWQQLFAVDRDGRLWTCQVSSSLICNWQLILVGRR